MEINQLDFDYKLLTSSISYNKSLKETKSRVFILGLTERVSDVLLSLNILCRTEESILQNEFSCSLLVRTIMMDCFILSDFALFFKENIEVSKLEDYAEEILKDGINNVHNYINKAKKFDIINEVDYQKRINEFKSRFITFEKKRFKRNLTDSIDIALKDLKDAIKYVLDYYEMYSKNAHYGFFYLELRKIPISKRVEHLRKSFIWIHFHIGLLLSILVDLDRNNEFNKLQFQRFSEYKL
jgi:hypothetical protein